MAVDTPWLGEYTWEEHGFDGDGTRSKPLPNEVVDMFRPHQCLLCNITASNLQCVYAHYESQSHFKKVAHFMREKYNVLGTLKAKKDQFQPVECDICQVTLTRRILYLQHLDSKQHLKNMKKKGDSDQPSTPQASETMNMYATIPQPPPLPKIGEYVCSLCTVTTPTKAQMELHNSGARHMKNISKLADGDLRDFFAENGNCEPIIVDSLTPDPPKEKPPENNLVNPFMYPYAGNSMYGQPTAPYAAGNPQMMPQYQQYPYGSQYNQYPYPYQYPANYDYSSWQGQGYQQYPPLPDTTMPPPTYDNPTNDDATLTSPSVTAPADKPEVKPSESDTPPEIEESPLPEGFVTHPMCVQPFVKLLKDEATPEEADGKTSTVEDDNGKDDDPVEPVEKATDEEEHDDTRDSPHSENEDPITNDAQVIDNIDQLDHTPAENFKEFTISSKPTLNRLTTFMSSLAEDEASKEVKKRPVIDSESEEHEDVETTKPSKDGVKALNDSLEKEVQESLVNYEITEPVEDDDDTTFASRDNDVSNDESKAEADKMVPEEQNVKNNPKIEESEPDLAEEMEKTITTDANKKDHKEDKAQLIKSDDKKDKKSRSRSKSRVIRKRRSRSSSSASSSSSRDSLKRRRRRSRSRSWSRSPDRRRRFRPNYRRPDNYNRGYNPNFRQQRYRNYYPNRNQWSRGSNYRNYGRREDRSYWNNREENDRRRYRNRREYTDRRPRRRSVSRSASSSSASKSRSRSPRRDDRKMKNKPEGRPVEEKFDDKVVQVSNDQPIMKRASRIDINITSVKVDEEHSFMSENHSPASFNSMSPKNDKEKETIDDEAEINDKEAEIINKEKEIIAKVKPFQPICDPVLLDRLSPVCNPTTQTWDTESQKVKSETYIKQKESHREEEEGEDVSQLLTKMIILKKKMAEEEAYKEQRQKDKSKKKKRRRSASSSSSSSSSSESSSSSSSSSCSVPTDLLSRFIATMKHSGAPSGKVKEDVGDVKKGDKKKKKKKKKRKKKKKEKKTKKSSRNDHDSSNLSSFVNSRGLYECKLCDVTAATDMSFVEHLLSEKHKNIFQLIKSQQIQ